MSSSSSKVQQIRFKTFLKATGANRKAFFASGAGLDPLLEAKDIERISAGLGKYGKTAQGETARLPMELLNEVLSFVTPPQMAVLNAQAFPTARSVTTLERCMDISHGVLYLITENPSFKKPPPPPGEAKKKKKERNRAAQGFDDDDDQLLVESTSSSSSSSSYSGGSDAVLPFEPMDNDNEPPTTTQKSSRTKEEDEEATASRRDLMRVRDYITRDSTDDDYYRYNAPVQSTQKLEKRFGGPDLPKFMAALGTHPKNGLATDRAQVIRRYLLGNVVPAIETLHKERVLVIRDGAREGLLMPWADVVPGDLVILKPPPTATAMSTTYDADEEQNDDYALDERARQKKAKDRAQSATESWILADCYLLAGAVSVEMSMLTGETDVFRMCAPSLIPEEDCSDADGPPVMRELIAGCRLVGDKNQSAEKAATDSAVALVCRTGASTFVGHYGML